MPHRVVPDGALPCVWMSAGLLKYKLCDRDFQCDHCPLDAGLRGRTSTESAQSPLLAPRRDAGDFPDDRQYSKGHCWVKPIGRPEERRYRFGLDAFAAGLIGHCDGVRWEVSPDTIPRGSTLCQVDLGLAILSIRAPLEGVLVEGNRSLHRMPGRLITTPYSDGWIVEFRSSEAATTDQLLSAREARERTRMDLQRFRRRVAMQLFADGQTVGASMADGGELVTDLRQMLGGSAYLDLLRELVY